MNGLTGPVHEWTDWTSAFQPVFKHYAVKDRPAPDHRQHTAIIAEHTAIIAGETISVA